MVPVILFTYVGIAFLAALSVQAMAFIIARARSRIDVVDVAWGLSFVAIVIGLYLYDPRPTATAWIVMALVTLWGVRLAWHIGQRFIRSAKQDERYTTLMQNWPKRNVALQQFIRIFLVQATLATIISLPVIVIYTFRPEVQALTFIGLAIWIAGYVMESVADWQLKQFIKTAKPGELMRTGLWHYSRHPNYFGEITMWWGIALIAFTTPFDWIGVIGAVTITYLIVFVSGIPPSEARMATRKGWVQYKRTTSVLLPWSPK